jgi:hypothetical protein
VLSDATFARGFVEEAVLANVPRELIAKSTGAAEWATLKRLALDGKHAAPARAKPLPVLAKLVGHEVMRSLVALTGMNEVLVHAIAQLPIAKRLETLGVDLSHPGSASIGEALRSFTLLRTLAVAQNTSQSGLWDTVDTSRLEHVEVHGMPFAEAVELSPRIAMLHVRGDLSRTSRTPDLLFWGPNEARQAWVNLGAVGHPRAELLDDLEALELSRWAKVTVFARELFGAERARLDALKAKWPGLLEVTATSAAAPCVPLLLRDLRQSWQRPDGTRALASVR